jgi:hypothetical protein
MISYYRVYYDLQITTFDKLQYLFIYKPLPNWEISQDTLCNFINTNEKLVGFKCSLNKDIYAIVRYIP